MNILRKSFAHLSCPNCDGKFQSQRGGDIGSGCLSVIAMEFVFWLLMGLAAFILDKCIDDSNVFYLAVFLLFLFAIVLGRITSTYICQKCNEEVEFGVAKGIGWLFIPNKANQQ